MRFASNLAFAIHCKNPILHPMMLAKCAKSCRLCDQPGEFLDNAQMFSEICTTARGL